MGRYTGPKLRLSRHLGVPIAETPKHVTPKRGNQPGVHRRRWAKQSLYALQLREKQKLAAYYSIRDRQFRRYIRMAQSSKLPTDRALLECLEMRLDNVIRRLRWARTIWQARQVVSHGHCLLNGRKVDVPSQGVEPGDVITVREAHKPFVRQCEESVEGMGFRVPDWLSVDKERLEATVLHPPRPDEVLMPFEIDFSKILEFYTR